MKPYMPILKSVYLICLMALLGACSNDDASKQTSENSATPPLPPNAAKALTIDDRSLTTSDFDHFASVKYSEMLKIPNLSDARKSRIFDAFIEHTLVLNAAQKEGFSISKAETAAYLTDLRIDPRDIDEGALNEEALIQKYLSNKVYSQISVENKECQDYYNKNRAQYKKNRQIMLHQIQLKDQKRAFEIKEILEGNPARFEEFARSDSQSMDAKKNGVMGFFEQGQLPQEIEKYVFALKLNNISQVIQSPYGFHIFRVSQIRDGHTLYFDSVKDEIKNTLLSDKLRMAYTVYLSQLKNLYKISIHFENLPFKYESESNGGTNETPQ